MSNELHAHTTSGLTLYAVLLNSTGQIWNTSGTPAFEAYNGANWTDYDIALTEAGAGIYLGTMPTTTAGAYSYAVYEQAGASPATTDTLRGTGWLEWSGSAVVAVATLNDITVADIIAGITEGTLDLQEILRIMLAALAGKASGGGTATIKFRDHADTKDRITATVDVDGNRTLVVVDGS